ncbi:MAG: hypothetical protein IJ736_11750 [Firmicutes bacterium]|nr:hypothetical protein [Bacillota bacterium]
MKKFLFLTFIMMMFASSAVFADISERAYTGGAVRIYLSEECNALVMVNEIKDGKNIFDDDSIVYIDYLKAETAEGNSCYIDIPVGAWYDKNKRYAIRINGDEKIYFFGDADLDGKVTREDAKEILRCAFEGKDDEKELSFVLCDVDGDGYVNASDSAEVLLYSVVN